MRNDDILCICGRLQVSPHCIVCGSADVRALASRTDKITRDNGQIEELTVYRCRKCAKIFNEDDRKLHCNAPQPRAATRAATRLALAHKKERTDEERRQFLEDMGTAKIVDELKKRGW